MSQNISKMICILIISLLFLLNIPINLLGDIQIEKVGINSDFPVLALSDNDDIFIAYAAGHPNLTRGDNDLGIYFTKMKRNDIDFSTPKIISQIDHSGDTMASDPEILSVNGTIFIVYPYLNNIYLTRSFNLGESFEPPRKLNMIDKCEYPNIAGDENGNIYVVWDGATNNDYNISFAVSRDNGNTFMVNSSLIKDETHSNQYNPVVRQYDNKVFILWADSRDQYDLGALYSIYSNDFGRTFSEEMNLSYRQILDFGYPMYIAANFDGKGYFYLFSAESGRTCPTISKFDYINKTFLPGIEIQLTNCPKYGIRWAIGENFYFLWNGQISQNGTQTMYMMNTDGYNFSKLTPNVRVIDPSFSGTDRSDVKISKNGTLNIAFRGYPGNATGNAWNVFFTKYTPNRPPMAIISNPMDHAKFLSTQSITLSANGSFDPDNDVLSYYWESNISGYFSDSKYYITTFHPGNQKITLWINDNHGHNVSTSIDLESYELILTLIVSKNQIYTFEEVNISCISNIPSISYFFDYGDNSNSSWISSNFIHHEYFDEKVYEVKVKIKYLNGFITNWSEPIQITVLNRLPIPIIEFCKVLQVKNEYQFNGTKSYDKDGNITRYIWNFGDNTESFNSSPDHIFYPGTYKVSLSVLDDDNVKNDTSISIKINATPPVSNFTVTPKNGTIKTVFKFSSTSYDPDGNIVEYSWDFGDESKSNSENPTHLYSKKGIFEVVLSVKDKYNLISKSYRYITIFNLLPIINISVNKTVEYTLNPISFSANNSYDDDGVIQNNFWNFSDSNYSNRSDVIHFYSDDGLYKVCLRITDNDGGENNTCINVTILNRKPIAIISFVSNKDKQYTGILLSIFSNKSYDRDGKIISYSWYIDNVTVSSNPGLIYTFKKSGTHRIQLQVTDDDGEASITSKNVVIKARVHQETSNYLWVLIIIICCIIVFVVYENFRKKD